MKKTIHVMVCICVLLSLHGCVAPAITIFTFHIGRGGSGTIEVRQLNLQSDAEGQKAKQEVIDFITSFEALVDPEVRAQADQSFLTLATDYTQEIGYDDEGHLNTEQRGGFDGIFQMLQAMEITNRENELSADQTFSYEWDGNTLTLAWGWENDEVEEDAADTDNPAVDEEAEDNGLGSIEFVITTEGEIDFVSIGQLSADRKTVVIAEDDLKAAERARLDRFEIRISELAKE